MRMVGEGQGKEGTKEASLHMARARDTGTWTEGGVHNIWHWVRLSQGLYSLLKPWAFR